MAENKKDKKLISLAKSGTKKPVIANKPEVVEQKPVVPEKPKTPEEVRNIKAKESVEKLLEGVSLTPNVKEEKEELLEIASDDKKNGLEWLQEQVDALATENGILRTEAQYAKEDYRKIFDENQRLKNGVGIQDDGMLKMTVVKVFNELQSNYISMGHNPMTGAPNFVINPPAFMNRLILFFPFLQDEKKF